jgi:hypothetical protein
LSDEGNGSVVIKALALSKQVSRVLHNVVLLVFLYFVLILGNDVTVISISALCFRWLSLFA